MRQGKVSWSVGKSPKQAILLALLLAVSLPLAWAEDTATGAARPDLQGAWEDPASGEVLFFEGERVIGYSGETLSIRGIVRREPGTLVVRHQGLLETWGVALDVLSAASSSMARRSGWTSRAILSSSLWRTLKGSTSS
jgi:hypothetical protein